MLHSCATTSANAFVAAIGSSLGVLFLILLASMLKSPLETCRHGLDRKSALQSKSPRHP